VPIASQIREVPMMYWWGQQMHGWGWGLMSLASFLLLALMIAGVVAVARLTYARAADARVADRPPAPPATPRSLLADRYARGEIDEAEYRHRVDVLNETAGNGPTTGP
jgi:putative membrane protein